MHKNLTYKQKIKLFRKAKSDSILQKTVRELTEEFAQKKYLMLQQHIDQNYSRIQKIELSQYLTNKHTKKHYDTMRTQAEWKKWKDFTFNHLREENCLMWSLWWYINDIRLNPMKWEKEFPPREELHTEAKEKHQLLVKHKTVTGIDIAKFKPHWLLHDIMHPLLYQPHTPIGEMYLHVAENALYGNQTPRFILREVANYLDINMDDEIDIRITYAKLNELFWTHNTHYTHSLSQNMLIPKYMIQSNPSLKSYAIDINKVWLIIAQSGIISQKIKDHWWQYLHEMKIEDIYHFPALKAKLDQHDIALSKEIISWSVLPGKLASLYKRLQWDIQKLFNDFKLEITRRKKEWNNTSKTLKEIRENERKTLLKSTTEKRNRLLLAKEALLKNKL
jgi:hypothetical protein